MSLNFESFLEDDSCIDVGRMADEIPKNMNKKTISIRDKTQKAPLWKFPFSEEDVKRIRISIEPGIVRWFMPEDLFERMPNRIELLYTNIFGMLLVISPSEEDLRFLDKLIRSKNKNFVRLVYPNTDDSVTVKKRFKRNSFGLLMKVRDRNLALRQYMDRYSRTKDRPAIPRVALGRFLVVNGRKKD